MEERAKIKDKVLKIISDNSMPKNFCEYGEGIFADVDAVDNIAEDVVKLFSIHVVNQRSEMYFAFMEEYNALMGESEYQILKEEVVVLLAKYS